VLKIESVFWAILELLHHLFLLNPEQRTQLFAYGLACQRDGEAEENHGPDAESGSDVTSPIIWNSS
jgi:hypothetical protein